MPAAATTAPHRWPPQRWDAVDLWPIVLSSFGFALFADTILMEWLGLQRPAYGIAAALIRQAALVVPAIWWLRLKRRPVAASLGLVSTPVAHVLLGFAAGLGLFVLSYAVRSVTGSAIEAVLGHGPQGRDYLAEFPGGWRFAFATVAVLVAPLCEEIFFRGVVFGGVRSRRSLVVATVSSAALFAFVHDDLARLPDLFVAGVIYAVLYERSRSLAVPIAAHLASNVLAVILTFG
jgi:membrane protease YdiL (CAAX protease family)